MDFLFFDDVLKKPYMIPALIIVSSIAILILNVYGLTFGITYVLPHLFYIPIIITAYYFPRRGVLFAIGLSVVYCAMSFTVVTPTTVEMLSAIARSGVFIVIGGVVSYLSGRMHHDTQMCRRLVSVVKSSADAISGETLNGIVTDWNTGAELLYGYTSREMVGNSVFSLIPPERHEEKRLLLEKIRQGELVERVDTERIKKDGTRIQVSLSLSPIFNSIGEIIGISDIAHDITERQRFQHEILRAKERWELTFEAVPDMIAIIDDHFRIVQANKAMADRLGVSPEDAVGQTCYEVVHHTQNPPAICPHQLLLKDGQSHSIDIHEDNLNGDFFLTVSPIRDPSGAVLGSVHVLRDVTERKKAENALKESEEKYRSIFNNFTDLYYMTDINGIITTLSPSVQKLSGWTPEELIGHSTNELYPFPEERNKLIDKLLRTGEVKDYEVTLLHKNGNYIKTSVSCHVIYDDVGKPSAIEGTLRDITERGQAEEALKQLSERLSLATRAGSVGIWDFDVVNNMLIWDDQMFALYGITREQFSGAYDAYQAGFHPDDRLQGDVEIQMALNGEKEFNIEFRVLWPDGSTHYIRALAIVQRDSEGKPLRMIGTNWDITEQKTAEEELQRKTALLEAQLTSSFDGILVIDEHQKRVISNQRIFELFNVPRHIINDEDDTLLLKHVVSLTKDPSQFLEKVTYLYAHPSETSLDEIEFKSGMVLDRYSAPVLDTNGKCFGRLWAFHDITERKRAEDALKKSEEMLNETGRMARVGGWELDVATMKQVWTEEVYRIHEVEPGFMPTAEEGISFYAPEARPVIAEALRRAIELGEPFDRELAFITAKGNHRWVHAIGKAHSVDGKTINVAGTFQDITERKRVEEALALASKKLSLLSSITRHDINNQLMALNAYISLSGDAINNPAELKEFIGKEQTIADAITRQISFTKDYEDLGVKAPIWQNVTAIFKNVIPRLPMRNISVDSGDPDLELYADPLLEKVFYNLVDNALRYGGEKMTAIHVTTRKDNGVLVIAVEDDGNGISAEDKKKLFTKGFGKHTGLGLFLSREILSLTGITIRETGEPGKGARFEIAVPNGGYRMKGDDA